MEKITVIKGDSFIDVNQTLFNIINQFDFSKKNIVLCPEGAQNLCVDMLLKANGVAINVEVVTIQDFVQKFVGKCTSDFKQRVYIKAALKNLEGNLNVFKGAITSGVCQAVQNEILRFQQANLYPQDLFLIKPEDVFLQNKLLDLAKIFEQYQILTKNVVDRQKQVLLFCQKKVDFSNVNFFFVSGAVDNLQNYKVFEKIAQTANNVFVAVEKSTSQANGYVYPQNLFFNENKLYSAIQAKNFLNIKQQKIKNLAFSVLQHKEDLSFMQAFEAPSPQQEVFALCKIIKQLLYTKQASPQDILVLCGNLESYRCLIEKTFQEFGFGYCINSSISIKDDALVRFVCNALSYVENPSQDNLINLIQSDCIALNQDDKNMIVENLLYFDLKDILASTKVSSEHKSIISCFLEKLGQVSRAYGTDKVLRIIEQFELEKYVQSECATFKNFGFEQKSIEKLFVFEKVKSFLDDFVEFDLNQDILELFTEYVKTQYFLPPTSKIGDIIVNSAQTFVAPRKFLFLLGANEGVMPLTQNDTAILTDDNILSCSYLKDLKLVRNINRQFRHQVFENLLMFEEKLFIFYSSADSTGQKLLPSGFVKSLVEFSKHDALSLLSKTIFPETLTMSNKQKASFFARLVGSKKALKEEVIKIQQTADQQFWDLLPSAIDVVGGIQPLSCDALGICQKKNLFFQDDKTKISQIEAYYSCPFKHFMTYGLKLKEKQSLKFETKDVGNILHKVAEEFLSSKNKFVDTQNLDIENAVKEIFEKLKHNDTFEKFFHPKNLYTRMVVETEAKRFCAYLYATLPKSKFKPKFLEVYFGKNQKFELKVRDENFSLVGIVDRVDVFNDGAVVIDYKTGDSIKGNNNELFYGEKIQIFVYAKAIEQLFNLKPKGVFYLPIVNKFLDDTEQLYMLRGKNINNSEFLSSFDTTLTFDNPKSSLFPCAIKVNKDTRAQGIIEYQNKTNFVTEKEFQNMLNYAIELVQLAIEEILDGNIEACPTDSACSNCPYLSICQKSTTTKVRTHSFDINAMTFGVVNLKGGQNDPNSI